MADEHPSHEPPVPEPYHGAAAGWGALFSTAKHIWQNQGVVRNSLSLLKVNQPDGFDCPGCAWPDPAHAGSMEFCENGVKAVTFETTAKRVTPAFFAEHPVAMLKRQTHHWLENQGRLTEPMRYDAATDRYRPITWADAFALIGSHLKKLASPDEAIFYTSGRTSNEAAFLYQLFARKFGTNNLPDCSNMCHESSGAALGEAIGVGKGSVRLDDFELADAIYVIGQNPGTNHPRMLVELERAAKRGAKIVTINPLREVGLVRFTHPKDMLGMLTGGRSAISTHYYQVQVGGDLAMIKGILKHVFEAERRTPGQVLDAAFIRDETSGFAELKADIEQTTWHEITKHSGLSESEIREAGDVYLAAQRVIICWAMGLTQHKHAVATIQYLVNLLLVGGHLGRPGAGVCPVRGHSNVQGDRTMGIIERPSPAFLAALERVFGFTPPSHHGYDVVAAIDAMHRGLAKVFIGLGGNFAAATPDTPVTEAALAKCELTVHVSTKLNRSHVITGRDALILPCLGRTEIDQQASGLQKVTVEDSMSQVHASQGNNPPASPSLMSEVAIVCGIAKATLGTEAVATKPAADPANATTRTGPAGATGGLSTSVSRSQAAGQAENESSADSTPTPQTLVDKPPVAPEHGNVDKPSSSPIALDWDGFAANYDRIRDAIAATLPDLFHDLNQRIGARGGFYLGNAARDRVWKTATGKARFLVHPIADLRLPPGQLKLMTIRSHDQFNTTVYDLHDRYRGIRGTRMVIFLHPDDIAERGLKAGQLVDITSHTIEDGIARSAAGFAVVPFDIPRGCAAAYFPETNVLVSRDSFADKSRTPLSKFIPITLAPSRTGAGSAAGQGSGAGAGHPATAANCDRSSPAAVAAHADE